LYLIFLFRCECCFKSFNSFCCDSKSADVYIIFIICYFYCVLEWRLFMFPGCLQKELVFFVKME
jgi:hypothetical protein